MSSDFGFQMQYVRDSAWRILDSQDANPLSPTFGCLHTAYWRDKTSEFPDSRFQEGGAALGLLLHPCLRSPSSPSVERLRAGFTAAVRCWARQQNADGSFDEWYKGEHGFAATAFGTVAFGLCLHLVGDELDPATRSLLREAVHRAAGWLRRHDDLVKTNHEAAGAAALAVAANVVCDPGLLDDAHAKNARAIASQTDEGWFPEVGGADLGYTFVLVDYLMLYRLMTGDESSVAAATRAYAFAARFLRPDLTVSGEAGLCGNPYVSRLGTVLLADRAREAAWVLHELLARPVGPDGITPYLSDDLRLFRWGCLPLLAWLFLEDLRKDDRLPGHVPPPAASEWISFPRAGLMAKRLDGRLVEFFPASGGLVHVSAATPSGAVARWQNQGLSHRAHGRVYVTATYDPSRPAGCAQDVAWCDVTPSERRFVFPGLLARLALRLACAVPGLAAPVRAAIDWYRVRHRTAGNQSATSVGTRPDTTLVLRRTVSVSRDGVVVVDRIQPRASVRLADLAWIIDGQERPLAEIPFKSGGRPPSEFATGAVHEFRQDVRFSFGDATTLDVIYTHGPAGGSSPC